MIRFNNDYNKGCYEGILRLMTENNGTAYAGYGTDEWCEKGIALIRKAVCAPDAAVWFFPGATQANLVTVAAALRPTESVICAETGHINCHEAASIENTGHKILTLPHKDGKITAEQIGKCAAAYAGSGGAEYLTEPKMVYISFPTELGTLYTKKELTDISRVCLEYGMLLFVDGARMAYGISSPVNDVTLADLASLADVFYLGGTKCGALFGEALVITADPLKRRFKSYMKQHGAVLAKGWLLGLQFFALLVDGAYFTLAERADRLALRIREAFVKKGIPLYADSYTNQQFVILTAEQMEKLSENYWYEPEDKLPDGRQAVRFCTSFATTEEEVGMLVGDIERL